MTETKNIYTELLKVQEDLPTIEKDSKNPHLKNLYASLPRILSIVNPILRKHGILLSSNVRQDDPEIFVVTLIHAESQTHVSSHIKLINMLDMQKWGGSVTYATRYGLLALLGIAADMDDDGNSVSAPPTPTHTTSVATVATAHVHDSLKENIRKLWELKGDIAKKADSVQAGRVEAYVANDFKKDKEPLASSSLIAIQNWLKTF